MLVICCFQPVGLFSPIIALFFEPVNQSSSVVRRIAQQWTESRFHISWDPETGKEQIIIFFSTDSKDVM